MSMAMLLNAATVVSSAEPTARRGRIPITALLSSDPQPLPLARSNNPLCCNEAYSQSRTDENNSPTYSHSPQPHSLRNQEHFTIPRESLLPLPAMRLPPSELSDLTSSLTSSLPLISSQSEFVRRIPSPPSPSSMVDGCSDESSAGESVRGIRATSVGSGSGGGDVSRSAPRRRWKPCEDSLLVLVVSKHGPGRWNRLAEQFPGRNGRQVRLRWVNHLQPSLDKREWRKEEDDILLKAHSTLGNKWSLIATQLNGQSGGRTRTDNSVKNRYKSLVRRSQREHRAIGEARV